MPELPTQQEIRSAADYIGRAMNELESKHPNLALVTDDLYHALLELGHIRIRRV